MSVKHALIIEEAWLDESEEGGTGYSDLLATVTTEGVFICPHTYDSDQQVLINFEDWDELVTLVEQGYVALMTAGEAAEATTVEKPTTLEREILTDEESAPSKTTKTKKATT